MGMLQSSSGGMDPSLFIPEHSLLSQPLHGQIWTSIGNERYELLGDMHAYTFRRGRFGEGSGV